MMKKEELWTVERGLLQVVTSNKCFENIGDSCHDNYVAKNMADLLIDNLIDPTIQTWPVKRCVA